MAEVDVDHNGKMDLSEFILMMHKQVSSGSFLSNICFWPKPGGQH